MNGRVEVMMSHLPGGASPSANAGTPRASFKKEMTTKTSMPHELVQVCYSNFGCYTPAIQPAA